MNEGAVRYLFVGALLFVMLGATGAARAAPVAAQAPVSVADAVREGDEGPAASPRGALFRSLVLPGWGQAYAGAPGRGVVYFGMASGSAWMTQVARRQLQDARRQQAWLRAAGDLAGDEETPLVEARAQHFEDWAALSIFLFFLAGADAYVAAYLADFEERIGVSAEAEAGLRFELRVPVGRPR